MTVDLRHPARCRLHVRRRVRKMREGYVRISAFNCHENVQEVMERIARIF